MVAGSPLVCLSTSVSLSLCDSLHVGAANERRLELLHDVYESMELVHTNEGGAFLSSFFMPFTRLLHSTQPAFSDGPVQQLRSVILSALSR